MNFDLGIMKRLGVILVLLFWLTTFPIYGQVYTDYLGAGHSNGVTVTSSSNSSGTNGINTVNANGITIDYDAASRFLGQSSLGYDYEEIVGLAQTGVENWIDNEFNKPSQSFEYIEGDIYNTMVAEIQAIHGLNAEVYRGSFNYNRAFWQHTLTNNDLLRQRVAFALSEIFVVSGQGSLEDRGEALACF